MNVAKRIARARKKIAAAVRAVEKVRVAIADVREFERECDELGNALSAIAKEKGK